MKHSITEAALSLTAVAAFLITLSSTIACQVSKPRATIEAQTELVACETDLECETLNPMVQE